MPIKTPTNIMAWMCTIGFVSTASLLLYNNFGPRQDISGLLPLDLMEQLGVEKSNIKFLRSHADKIGHFIAGLILTSMMFFAIKPESKLTQIFSIKTLGVFFITCLSIAEIGQYIVRNWQWQCGQYLFSTTQCNATAPCNSLTFSYADIAAGFLGSFSFLIVICFFKLRQRKSS